MSWHFLLGQEEASWEEGSLAGGPFQQWLQAHGRC